MSPKIPPFPPREFATIDEVLANIPAGVAQDAPLVPSSRVDVPGKVYIAGGGPGALDLLTLRAVRALGEADVVLLDHLAPQELAEYAPNALIIDVGKVPGKHAVPQSRIQQLMIDYALAGKTVVRLKGGDPYVYGRGAEELDACFAAGLDAEVIPGITSAIAVPAQASIPVTLRKVSSIFTVVSGHSRLDETDIQAVVSTLRAHGTVVLLMGVRTLPDTIEQIMLRGVESDMPLATIEKGFTNQERVIVTTLQRAEYAPNALIIDVGKVPGKHAVPQSRIQQLMIDYALAGKTVVRLKGGDPYVYGRGAEELDACFAAGLDAEVIPGITSAIAVPAQASIPVTLRKVSSIFTVVSGHSRLDETDIQAVVSTLRAHGTVVLLMGVRTLPDTIEQIMLRGVESDMPLATIEKGFTNQERVIVTTLQRALQDCRDVKSPAITVIGEVVYYARDDQHQFISHVHERLREQSTS